MEQEKLSPLMEQYVRIRKEYPEAILLFQVGDFYELFFDDAKTVAGFLGIALTKRGKCNGVDIPLCGIPVHALRHYLAKLVNGGFCIAICDQVSEPRPGAIVERAVSQVITPGTIIDPLMLDEKSASYVCSCFPVDDRVGLVFGELLSAQLFATTIPIEHYRALESTLVRFFPDEIIVPQLPISTPLSRYFKEQGYWVSVVQLPTAEHETLDELFDRDSLWLTESCMMNEQDLRTKTPALHHSLYILQTYLARTQKITTSPFRTLQFFEPDDYLTLDAATLRNLEIIENNRDGSRTNTLLAIMDRARTPMGSRTVKKWLLRPLIQKQPIMQRAEVVALMQKNISLLHKLEEVLAQCGDLERIVGRIALRKASLNDYHALQQSLAIVPFLQSILYTYRDYELVRIVLEKLADFSALYSLLDAALDPDTAANIIKRGFDHELDRLRDLFEGSEAAIQALEEEEIARTGITSLKIRHNKISGYAIEVTKANFDLVPQDYQRQQTLSNRERYVTPRLIALERDITRAQNERSALELVVFDRVKELVAQSLHELRQAAYAISYIDALYSFAKVAYDFQYEMPQMSDERDIIIERGRHPVVEQALKSTFIPNHTILTDQQALWIITGPNMGGKSTYLRQVALICLLAQCGSLVPAQAAQLPILDRIFTRIGAGDHVAEGKSTFLVEMEETASICRLATEHSLVILDEVGRGTSTYDGLAIAQAVIEYIYHTIKARCLFATHYHELTTLHNQFPGIVNYYMDSQQTKTGILFLHTLKSGVAHGSFGIEVARLAQLPTPIVTRARELLAALSCDTSSSNTSVQQSFITPATRCDEHATTIMQLQQQLEEAQLIKERLARIDLDELTPRAAFDLIWQLKK